jgi:hypothetical protein
MSTPNPELVPESQVPVSSPGPAPEDLEEYERRCREMTIEQLEESNYWLQRCFMYDRGPYEKHPHWPKICVVNKVLNEKEDAARQSVANG